MVLHLQLTKKIVSNDCSKDSRHGLSSPVLETVSQESIKWSQRRFINHCGSHKMLLIFGFEDTDGWKGRKKKIVMSCTNVVSLVKTTPKLLQWIEQYFPSLSTWSTYVPPHNPNILLTSWPGHCHIHHNQRDLYLSLLSSRQHSRPSSQGLHTMGDVRVLGEEKVVNKNFITCLVYSHENVRRQLGIVWIHELTAFMCQGTAMMRT